VIYAPGFADQSALLKHELAYCLGQMKLVSALPVLQTVLENLNEDPMVRHEVSVSNVLLRTVSLHVPVYHYAN
jgi:deoxyhypusine monooxygenase